MKIIYLLSTLFLSTFGLSLVPKINENVELVNAGNGIFNLNVPENCHMAIRCEDVNPGPTDIPRPPRYNFTDLTSTTPPRDTTTTTRGPKLPVINSQSPTRLPTPTTVEPTPLPTSTTVSPTLDVVRTNKTRSPAPTVSIRYDIDPFRALELNRHFNYKEYICHGNDRHISGCAQGRIAEFLKIGWKRNITHTPYSSYSEAAKAVCDACDTTTPAPGEGPFEILDLGYFNYKEYICEGSERLNRRKSGCELGVNWIAHFIEYDWKRRISNYYSSYDEAARNLCAHCEVN